MLTPDGAVALLRREGLLTPAAILDGHLRVIPAARRHHHLRVIPSTGPAYFLKQGLQDEGLAQVSHEAAIMAALHAPAAGAVAAHIPRFHGYVPSQRVLITELLADAVTLRAYRSARGQRSLAVARALGTILAALHRTDPASVTALDLPYSIRHDPPWVLDLPRFERRNLTETSGVGLDLIKVLQQHPRFARHFDRIRDGWRTDTLIHFDLKWDNVLVGARPSPRRPFRLTLIDWEFAGLGDPCWDAGSLLHDYLLLWIAPIASDIPIPEIAGATDPRVSIAKLQPAIRAFWQTYAARMGIDRSSAATVATRAVKFAAVRAVQSAYEWTQGTSQMPALVPYLLQCALNILERPRAAATTIFGLDLEEAA